MIIAGEFWQHSRKGSRELFITSAREMKERTSRLSNRCWTSLENPKRCSSLSRIVWVTTDGMRSILRWLKKSSIGGHMNRGSRDLRKLSSGTNKTRVGSKERELVLIRTTTKTNMAWRCEPLEDSDNRRRRDGWACPG